MKTKIVIMSLMLFVSSLTELYSQTFNEVIKAVASDGEIGDIFGYSVSISGDFAIVGARFEDHDENGNSFLNNAGSAYIFERDNGGIWSQVQKIVASDRATEAYFGYSVSISGNYLIVGASREDKDASGGDIYDAGAAYIFERGTTWAEVQKIVASDRETLDYFGVSVSISGDKAIVGAYREDEDINGQNSATDAGSAYIFERSTGWNEVQKIVNSDRALYDLFGSSVAISGNYAIIGALNEDEDANGNSTLDLSGSAYIFERDTSGNWSQVQKIVASDRASEDYFSSSVAISGNYIIVGAIGEDEDAGGGSTASLAGSAYIFERGSSGVWSQEQKIVASDREEDDNFGKSVSISGDKAIVGAYREDEDANGGNILSESGSAYIYQRNSSGMWNGIQKVVASDRDEFDWFGYSVAISNCHAIVGAYLEDASGPFSDAGTAYIFECEGLNCEPFQKNVGVASKNFHDLNIEPVNDGTKDFIVAGNLFDASMQDKEMLLQRVDDSGNIIWTNKYTLGGYQIRCFDIAVIQNFIFITGSIDVNGQKKLFIAKIDCVTGNYLDAVYYNVSLATLNVRGLQIIYSNSDATGDSTPDPGFVVSGFLSDCSNLDIYCSNNKGFIMRTDFALNPLWATELDTSIPNHTRDYDFVNNVTETSDGYFITGSMSYQGPGVQLQGVLAHKIDFQGNSLWDGSYRLGNSQDVSVDAYYDVNSNEIFMLSNYSSAHHFGITVFNNTTGLVNLSKSWYVGTNELDRYGFKIMESVDSTNNLIISGYDAYETWIDGSNNSQTGSTNLLIYEFEKATGNQVGQALQYLVPYVQPSGDEFNFWNSQMPLIYYPDISFNYGFEESCYYHVGYRTDPSVGFSEAELIKTPKNKINSCDRLDLIFNNNPINTNTISINTTSINASLLIDFSLSKVPIAITEGSCDPNLSIGDNSTNEEIKLYPNPTKERVTISIETDATYTLLNINGQILQQGKLTQGDNEVNLSNLSSGLYFINIKTDTGSTTLKLIKQ